MTKLPIQPIYTDDHGIIRFRGNKVVQFLLDNGGIDLNQLTIECQNCPEDWEQFAQLIGYSLSGFGDLSYVSDETYRTATAMIYEGASEKDARLLHLQEKLDAVRDNVRQAATYLFHIHPDDLHE